MMVRIFASSTLRLPEKRSSPLHILDEDRLASLRDMLIHRAADGKLPFAAVARPDRGRPGPSPLSRSMIPRSARGKIRKSASRTFPSTSSRSSPPPKVRATSRIAASFFSGNTQMRPSSIVSEESRSFRNDSFAREEPGEFGVRDTRRSRLIGPGGARRTDTGQGREPTMKRPRIRIGTLMLLIVIAALAVALVVERRTTAGSGPS